MDFSSRLSDDLEPNDFFRAVETRRARGLPLLDLTVSNPTQTGLEYPQQDIQSALAEAAGQGYQPDPKGLPAARAAVAEYYRSHGHSPSPDSIVLTSGTSEAYAYLFKLLCDPGESILYPEPSYPLVELVAGLEGVEARPYPLDAKDRHWRVASLSETLTPDARAVVAVSPNNPTGSMLAGSELSDVSGFCAKHGLALIVDEVFLDYPSPDREGKVVSSVDNPDALTFTLGGLSKSCGLPQMKLSWIAVSGPQPQMRQAISRLEFIADAFLSVGTPVQQAAPALLALGKNVREQIRRRVNTNDAHLRQMLKESPLATVAPREGGWYAAIGLPAGSDDEEVALNLLESRGVLVQPGFLYNYDDPVIVISLLTPEGEFREGAQRIRDFLAASPASRR